MFVVFVAVTPSAIMHYAHEALLIVLSVHPLHRGWQLYGMQELSVEL